MKKFVGYGFKRKTESIEDCLKDYYGWMRKMEDRFFPNLAGVNADIEHTREIEEIGPHETVEVFKITITPVVKKSKKRAKK